MDVAVQQVVADVGGGSFHELDEDFSFGNVEVVVQELTGVFGLPEEIFSNGTPELCGAETGQLQKGTAVFLKKFTFEIQKNVS